MARETPVEWLEVMAPKGIASLRKLAERAGIAHTAVTRLVHGDSESSDETVAAVADALGLSLSRVYEMAGINAPGAKWYSPPAEANRMNDRQRKALDELIRSMVTTDKAGEGHAKRPAPIGNDDRNVNSGDSSDTHRELPAEFYGLAAGGHGGEGIERQKEADRRGEEPQTEDGVNEVE